MQCLWLVHVDFLGSYSGWNIYHNHNVPFVWLHPFVLLSLLPPQLRSVGSMADLNCMGRNWFFVVVGNFCCHFYQNYFFTDPTLFTWGKVDVRLLTSVNFKNMCSIRCIFVYVSLMAECKMVQQSKSRLLYHIHNRTVTPHFCCSPYLFML
jgi:hypothetical protein